MSEHLLQLADADLRELAIALRAGRLGPPFSAIGIQRFVSGDAATGVASDLQYLSTLGLDGAAIAVVIDLLLRDRARRDQSNAITDLVTTGPEAPGVTNRDTGVVVRELFANATESVLVAGYAVYQGRHVFRALADRMQERTTLKVRLFLDVQRGPGDTTIAQDLIRRFADKFRSQQWPADRRLPDVFYDPRSLDLNAERRSCLHAKCVVVDRQMVFVSSANFTEAAQERNIELGLLVKSPALAEKVLRHFEALVVESLLRPIW